MLRKIFCFAALQFLLLAAFAQLPRGQATPEISAQEISEMKKEVAALEAEIREAEKNDPEEVANLKTQLDALKSVLAMIEKPAPGKPVKNISPVKQQLPALAYSPVTPVVLKQPVTPPTEAQAKDYFFWYKGKKINDSTLVTTRGTVVQYVKKDLKLIVQPDKKKDSFNLMVARLSRTAEDKQALLEQFDKMKNGFMYYPYIEKTLEIYDDLTRRYGDALNNTFQFEPVSNPLAWNTESTPESGLALRGPHALLEDGMNESVPVSEDKLLAWARKEIQLARQKIKRLPAIDHFPPPPWRDLGYCALCEPSAIRRQFIMDSLWEDAFNAHENEVIKIVAKVGRTCQLQGMTDSLPVISQEVWEIWASMRERMQKKARILLNRYGDNLVYMTPIFTTITGAERSSQLLDLADSSYGNDIITECFNRYNEAYKKYYDEQVKYKNHDFVLNLPFHFGKVRQEHLLSLEENGVTEILERAMKYNRFAISLDVDFILERKSEEGELEFRATGNLASSGKDYGMLTPDKCGYRLKKYDAEAFDLDNIDYDNPKKFADVTIAMEVKSGIKKVPDENGKLRNINYSGPPTWMVNLPDSYLDFCVNSIPDSLFLSTFSGDESVRAQAMGGMQVIRDKYTVDMGGYATLVWTLEEGGASEDEAMDKGNDVMRTMAGFGKQAAPADLQGKLKQRYEGYMQMDDARKALLGAMNTRKSPILFNAANRTEVVADQYQDSKRKLEDDAELVRGLAHFRLVHEPLKEEKKD
jgi:hypothetical protein